MGLVLLLELGCKAGDVLAGQRRRLGRECRVELCLQRHHRRRRRVVVGRPDDDIEEFAQHRERHVLANLPVLVHRGVTDLGSEVVAVRERQREDVVEVADEFLDDAAAVEARRSGGGR